MAYDYRNAMKHDIRQWIEDNYFDGDEDELIDELWYADPVTGNLSGSYTFNRYTAL